MSDDFEVDVTAARAGPPPLPDHSFPELGSSRPKAARDVLEPFEILRNYQILKRLAAGGMADVYLARSSLGRGVEKLVALKTVLPQFGRETHLGALFLSEARISATLDHPNLVQVFDFGEVGERPYLAMEFIHGRDLTAVIRRLREAKRPAPPAFAVAVAREVARALEYVHEKRDLDGRPLNLVHRDVSPGNVIVTPLGEVKLVDFGVVAADGATDADGLFVGKLGYLTTEQARGEKPAPHWDLYALGVVLYELLTLHRPYRVTSAEALIRGEVRDRRVAPSEVNSDVPPELDVITLVATERDAAAHFGSAREMREALEAVARRLPPFDVGGYLRELFGPALDEEATEVEGLMAEARMRDPRRRSTRLGRAARRLGRRIEGSRIYRRHPRALRAAVAAALLALLAGGFGASRLSSAEEERARRLEEIDGRIATARLVGHGDQALGLLLDARRRWPEDARVTRRLAALADRLETLGETAAERGNLAEAVIHLQAARQAAPERPRIAARLGELEKRVRAASSARRPSEGTEATP